MTNITIGNAAATMTTVNILEYSEIVRAMKEAGFSPSNIGPRQQNMLGIFARAIEQALLQSSEVRAFMNDAELYRKLKALCVTSIDFTGGMQPDDPERWCVLRRKDGIISSFTEEDLDHGVRAAKENSL